MQQSKACGVHPRSAGNCLSAPCADAAKQESRRGKVPPAADMAQNATSVQPLSKHLALLIGWTRSFSGDAHPPHLDKNGHHRLSANTTRGHGIRHARLPRSRTGGSQGAVLDDPRTIAKGLQALQDAPQEVRRGETGLFVLHRAVAAVRVRIAAELGRAGLQQIEVWGLFERYRDQVA